MAIAAFSGLSALGGGAALLISRYGATWAPLDLLATTAFQSFLVPGLILALVVGGSNLACMLFAWRRSRAAIDATLLAGGTLSLWIIAEIAQLQTVHPLQLIYGLLGLSLLSLGIHAAWRSHLPRHRWVISVTLAETFGFMIPAIAVVMAAGFWLEPGLQASLLTAAGLGLGVIGAAQWVALRPSSERGAKWTGWLVFAWLVALPLSFLPAALAGEDAPLSSRVALWISVGTLMAYLMAVITWQGVRRLRPRGAAP